MTPLSEALEDHSAEGIGILTAVPWRFTQTLVYAMVALVCTAVVWSFFGHADVLVTAGGALVPASDVRRLYAPIDGELSNIYIAEGQPVNKGDVVARLYARGAIEAAKNALEARLKLEDAERDWKEFPEKKALMEHRVAALREAVEVEERQHRQRLAEGTSKLSQSQSAQKQEARANLDEARRARDAARLRSGSQARVRRRQGTEYWRHGRVCALSAHGRCAAGARDARGDPAGRRGIEIGGAAVSRFSVRRPDADL